MRFAAAVYVILSLTANFIVDNFFVFLLAMAAFPISVWLVLTKRKKPLAYLKTDPRLAEWTKSNVQKEPLHK